MCFFQQSKLLGVFQGYNYLVGIMPTHDKEQANARRRVLYAQERDKNNKKQHHLYRDSRMRVNMSSSNSLVEPVDSASLTSPIPNPSNNQLNDAHQQFRKKMYQLVDMLSARFAKNVTLVL